MNKNEKDFYLTNRTFKTFSVIISGFQYAATLLFRIRDHIVITAIPKFTGKMVTIMRLKRVRLVISQMKLISKMVQVISLRRITVVALMKQSMKAAAAIIVYMPAIFVAKLRQKIVTLVLQGKLTIIISPTLASFFLLGTFDPSTLGTLDTNTLGDMDYTSS